MSFIRASSLACHKRTHTVTAEKASECNVGNKKFTQSGRPATQHLLCNSCSKEIVDPQDLPEHFVKDKNARMFTCSNCQKQLSSFRKLVQHLAQEHGKDEKYQCGLCRERESTVQTCDEYVCCVCDERLDTSKELRDHMTTIH